MKQAINYKVYVKGLHTVLVIRYIGMDSHFVCDGEKIMNDNCGKWIVYFEDEANDISTYDGTHPTDIGAMALFIANRILGDEAFAHYAKVRY